MCVRTILHTSFFFAKNYIFQILCTYFFLVENAHISQGWTWCGLHAAAIQFSATVGLAPLFELRVTRHPTALRRAEPRTPPPGGGNSLGGVQPVSSPLPPINRSIRFFPFCALWVAGRSRMVCFDGSKGFSQFEVAGLFFGLSIFGT